MSIDQMFRLDGKVAVLTGASSGLGVTFAQALGGGDGVAVFLFVITVAAAEAAVGLALFIKIFNEKQNIEADELDLLQH